MTQRSVAARILANTELKSPVLCPELRLRLITPDCALWRTDEAGAMQAGLPEPFWGFCWAGGQAMARYVLDRPALVRGKRVLDFGAGGGIVGIAAAKAGALRIAAADIDPIALCAIGMNAALNGVTIETIGENLLEVVEPRAAYDVVLVGDVLYDAELAGAVFPWMRKMRSAGARVLFSDPGRASWRRDDEALGRYRAQASFEAPADVDPDGSILWSTRIYELDAQAQY